MPRVRYVPLAWSLALLGCLAAAGAQPPARAPLPLQSPVQDKNFYLLSMLERTADVRQSLRSDADLARLASARREKLKTALATCPADVACYAGALLFADSEIASVAAALRALHAAAPGLRRLAAGPLRSSGVFERYRDKAGEDLLAQAWTDAARGINHAIEVYGMGHAPRYPAIDSISYDVQSPAFRALVRNILAVMEEDGADLDLFFQPSLSFALHLLDANHRDEAGRLEPLERGENAAALRRIRATRWDRFPYSAIVVPGSGTDRLGFALSAAGKLRLELAVRRWRQGQAPLILVSGGYVHPAQTPWAEAVEMKRSLVAEFGVPPDAILIEPHARHTTTNLRNAARQIYRYGVPFDKPALVTTDPDQSRTIESPEFAARCLEELGYRPYRLGRRLSVFDLEWFPEADALQADAVDPLDP